MAKKKKSATRKRRTRRSSRIAGVDTGAVMNMLTAAGGFVAANMLGRVIPIQNNLIKGGAKIVVAAFLPKFIKGTTGNALALGMGANGAIDVVRQFAPGLVSGVGEDGVIFLNGADELGAIPTLIGEEGLDELGSLDRLGEDGEMGEEDELGAIPTLID